jgi:hypothetical protein
MKLLFWEKGKYLEGPNDRPAGVLVSTGSDYTHAVDRRGMSHQV